MAKPNLSPSQRWRKATLKSFLRDKAAVKRRAKKAAQSAADKELVAQWRALRSIGAYTSKETPAVSRLTRSRRLAIRQAFYKTQDLTQYENGQVYRPLQKQTVEIVKYVTTENGTRVIRSKREKYALDRTHFTLLRKPPAQAPGNTLKTKKGLIVPHSTGTVVRNFKGKLRETSRSNGEITRFTREPISGLADILKLRDEILAGKIKLKPNEGLRLHNFGHKRGRGYLNDDLDSLADLITRYQNTMDIFTYWADTSEIVHYTRGKK